jgi:hypothetical protein
LASESKRTFSNLRSLCTTPCKWQTEIACATYLIIFLVSLSESPSFSLTWSDNSPPPAYSIIK